MGKLGLTDFELGLVERGKWLERRRIRRAIKKSMARISQFSVTTGPNLVFAQFSRAIDAATRKKGRHGRR